MKKFLLLLALTAITFTGCFEDGLGPDEPDVINIELSQSEFTLTGDAGEYELTVTSDYAWNASSNREWITLVNDSGKAGESILTFKVSKNSTGSDREGLITIFCDSYNLSVDVIVTQSENLPILKIAGEPIVHSAISVDVPLKTNALVSVGYKLVEKGVGTAPSSATLLFRTGKQIEGNSEVIHLTGNDGLDRGKTFILYVAATISDTEYYNNGEILSVEFTTPNSYDNGDVTVIRTNSEGADVLVRIPENIKQQGRRIKWGVTNIAMLGYNGNPSMPEMLHSCDWVYPAYLFKNDTILNINHYNAYRRNKNGEIGYYIIGNNSCIEVPANDPRVETGEATPIQYYYHFQPGEPLLILMSEVYHTDCDEYFKAEYPQDHIQTGCDKKHPTIDFGWGPGWYWYPYDLIGYANATGGGGHEDGELPMPGVGGGGGMSGVDPNKFWYEGAWYKQIDIRLPGPAKFDGTVKVDLSNLKTDSGTITFTPDNKTFAYFVGIFEDTNEYQQGYRDLVRGYLKGDESLMQWFTTSEMAGYFGIFPYYASEGIHVLKLEEYFAQLTPGLTYHIVVNAVNGYMEDGEMWPDVSAQNYQHITFKLPEFTTPEPVLEVTAYEPYSPYKVKFNVKNPDYATNPVKKVVWVANDTREFSAMFAQGYTYTDLVMINNGLTDLSEPEVAAVNSAAGYDMEFDVREDTHFTLAVMGWNQESYPSNPDKEGSKAYAEATTSAAPDATPLDMEKLNSLKGDWTATATIKAIDYSTEQPTITGESKISWKVTIGDLDTNHTLTADQYAIFEKSGVSKEAADAYLAELNEKSAAYNAAVLGQNRVLCQGWQLDDTRTLATASPWDLFLMEDYNASLVDYLFHDFGPKWFLQTDADGNIFVPVNYNRIQPLTRWFNGMNHYLCLGNYEAGFANFIDPNDPDGVQSVGIPVEVSADGKKVTLKSLTTKALDANSNEIEVTLYPNAIYDNQGSLYFYNPFIVSEVVLTKGWTEPTPAPAKFSTRRKASGKRVVNGNSYQTPSIPFSSVTFVHGKKKPEVKVISNKFPTPEQTHAGMKKLLKKVNPTRK